MDSIHGPSGYEPNTLTTAPLRCAKFTMSRYIKKMLLLDQMGVGAQQAYRLPWCIVVWFACHLGGGSSGGGGVEVGVGVGVSVLSVLSVLSIKVDSAQKDLPRRFPTLVLVGFGVGVR